MTSKDIQRQVARLGEFADDVAVGRLSDGEIYELCDSCDFSAHISVSVALVGIASREVFVLESSDSNVELPSAHLHYDHESVEDAAKDLIEQKIGFDLDRLIPADSQGGVHYCSAIRAIDVPADESRAEQGHKHYDFLFVFAYQGDKDVRCCDSGCSCRWIGVDDVVVKGLIGDLPLDDVVLSGIEKHEQRIKEELDSDYLTTPVAWYQLALANSYFLVEKMQAAEDMYIRSVRSFENTYDDQYETPTSILSALKNLALLYRDTSRPDMAVGVLEKGLEYSRMYAEWDDNFRVFVAKFESEIEKLR